MNQNINQLDVSVICIKHLYFVWDLFTCNENKRFTLNSVSKKENAQWINMLMHICICIQPYYIWNMNNIIAYK